ELGYFSGNLHWRVRFEGNELKIALEGPEETYLKRLQPFLETGRIQRLACG
ncbi:MAG TPA: urease accessory protein UreE, partial [Alphaproteobacteria bacterium]|nr:urease accessory protein UreE [Alphaproteobacteria bacterium]